MKKLAVALLAASVATAAFAAPTANNFYFGGKVGQSQYHKTVRLHDSKTNDRYHDNAGTTYGVFGGYRLNDHLAVEAGYQKFADNKYYVQSPEQFTGTHKGSSLDLSVKANQFIGDKVNVYAGAGLGVVFNHVKAGTFNQHKTQVAPTLAAGAEYYFNDAFALGAEYKNYFRTYHSKDVDGRVSVNQTVDGTTNRDKYKPNVQTVQLTGTYVFGQNKPVVVAPAPAPAAPVVTSEKFELSSDLLFATNQYKLNKNADEAFQGILAKYNNAKSVNGVTVEGYADRTGSAKYNLGLSQRRAQSVSDYLVAHGVKADLITTTGRGVTTEKSGGCYNIKNRAKLRACLAPDRRVDVTISGELNK